ncbi:HlyD family efflux transporter periplasmic adaptor subunit [Sulfuricurvum sp.]|uniref:HlyD family efflux transporter periplasmic adaptor subunit n=1 Tax=Sulfuricurvum sp. TaxID=2025608 RepID=UPI00198C53FC|nr:HlyD family efflux transporter periplasmic adaptor subunit [Sulfuricurvum sp.]MBD3798535.1 HlyD family efflux transporter periplasmic adaptor subunit [Campylobacterota bacterium]MBD3805528.1 HlyD family efflux transporter periplasmic adaptor subunit [Sulfuricurvum sp.]
MPIIFALLFLVVNIHAKEYYAKAEPYEIFTVSSNVFGEVIYADLASQGKVLGKKGYLQIDDTLDRAELQSVENKIVALNKTLEYNRQMELNYRQMVEMKQSNFDRIKDLAIKSSVEKDREYFDVVSSRNALLGVQKEIESLNISLGDLKLRRTQLRKSINDKHLSAPGRVLYQLMVKPSAVVNPGTPLAQIADIRKAKLTLYLSAEEAQSIHKKKIYLDGKMTTYTIDRLWKIADPSKLSSYRAEILISSPAQFSHLVKVEFK